MDPEVFNRSKVADQVIQDTFKNIDIVLMSFDMSKEYTKEFYRLLGVGSVFHGLPFSVTDTTPVQFSFKKRNKHDTSVELT